MYLIEHKALQLAAARAIFASRQSYQTSNIRYPLRRKRLAGSAIWRLYVVIQCIVYTVPGAVMI